MKKKPTRKVYKKGTIYVVRGLRPKGVNYSNGKWHWSEKLDSYYTHSKPEAIKAGYKNPRK